MSFVTAAVQKAAREKGIAYGRSDFDDILSPAAGLD
jgi:hypothetical protein